MNKSKKQYFFGPKEQQLSFTLETKCNFRTREIYLFGPIDMDACYKFIAAFRALDSEPGDILIILNSPGGDDASGFAIYETIKAAQNPVIIESCGNCESIAAMIMQAGLLRGMTPEARFMVHPGTVELAHPINTRTLTSIGKETHILNDRYSEIMSLRSNKPKHKVKELCQEESFLSAEEALDWGFIDYIINVDHKFTINKKHMPKGKVQSRPKTYLTTGK